MNASFSDSVKKVDSKKLILINSTLLNLYVHMMSGVFAQEEKVLSILVSSMKRAI